MSSPEASVGSVAMSPAHDAASASKDRPGGMVPVKITAFTLFSKMPMHIQYMVWEEVLLDCGQQGINFFQVYKSYNSNERTRSDRLRFDNYSMVATFARLKVTCKGLKDAIERHFVVATAEGEQFMPITVNTHSGETEVQVNVNDIVCFATNHDITSFKSFSVQGFPVDPGCEATTHTFFHPGLLPPTNIGCMFGTTYTLDPDSAPQLRTHDKWSWIRRVAMSYPIAYLVTEHVALAGHGFPTGIRYLACYPCIAWNLSGLRNLEEVFLIVDGVAKPHAKNYHQMDTELLANIDHGNCPCDSEEEYPEEPTFYPGYARTRPLPPVQGAAEEVEDDDPPLKVFHGSYREYYQIRHDIRGLVGGALHGLEHLAIHFQRCDAKRVAECNEAPRTHAVKFKLLSHMKK